MTSCGERSSPSVTDAEWTIDFERAAWAPDDECPNCGHGTFHAIGSNVAVQLERSSESSTVGPQISQERIFRTRSSYPVDDISDIPNSKCLSGAKQLHVGVPLIIWGYHLHIWIRYCVYRWKPTN